MTRKNIIIPNLDVLTFDETVQQVKKAIIDGVGKTVSNLMQDYHLLDYQILQSRSDIVKEIKNISIKPRGWRTWYRNNPGGSVPNPIDVKIATALYAAEKTKRIALENIRYKIMHSCNSLYYVSSESAFAESALDMSWLLMLYVFVKKLDFIPELKVFLDWSIEPLCMRAEEE